MTKLNFDFEKEELAYRSQRQYEVDAIDKNEELLQCEICNQKHTDVRRTELGSKACVECFRILHDYDDDFELTDEDEESFQILEAIYRTDYHDIDSLELKITNDTDIDRIRAIIVNQNIHEDYKEMARERFDILYGGMV